MKKFQIYALFAFLTFALPSSSFSQKLTPEDILVKHLDSIGTATARAGNTSRIVVGNADVEFTSQKNLPAQGRIVLASAADKMFWGLKLNALDYPFDKFSFDGSKAKVAFVRNGLRSILGNFVVTNDVLLKESLFGGTLSTSWALLDLKSKNVKLTSEGRKKVDGKDVYALGYAAKSDVAITLYFDAETFQHVRTEYKRTSSAGIGTSPNQSSRFSETRIKVTEIFADFKSEKGLTLPHKYRVLYSVNGQNGSNEIKWVFDLNEFAFDQKIADSTFDAETN